MLDLLWAISNPMAFEWAAFAETTRLNTKKIKVEKIETTKKSQNHLVQNLVNNTKSTVISTRYMYNYAPTQEIFYREKWWIIVSIVADENQVNPQVMALFKTPSSVEYYLEIKELN